VRNEEIFTALDSVLNQILLATQFPRQTVASATNESALPCSPPSLAGEGPGVGGSSADAT
jgi:hypothetical protein